MLNPKINWKCPAWLQPNAKQDGWIVVESKLEVIERIFRMTIRGGSSGSIAEKLSELNLPLMSETDRPDDARDPRPWTSAHVLHVLSNRALIGESLKQGERAFPVVIEPERFRFVQCLVEAKKGTGGHGTKDAKVNAYAVPNLFQSRLWCECGGIGRYVTAGKRLRCAIAYKRGDCDASPLPYERLEEKLAKALLQAARIPRRTPVLNDRDINARSRLQRIEEDIAMYADALNYKSMEILITRISALEQEKKELLGTLASPSKRTPLPPEDEILTWAWHERWGPQHGPKRDDPKKYLEIRRRFRTHFQQIVEKIVISRHNVDGARRITIYGPVAVSMKQSSEAGAPTADGGFQILLESLHKNFLMTGD